MNATRQAECHKQQLQRPHVSHALWIRTLSYEGAGGVASLSVKQREVRNEWKIPLHHHSAPPNEQGLLVVLHSDCWEAQTLAHNLRQALVLVLGS